MVRKIIIIALIFCSVSLGQDIKIDRIAAALDSVGFTKADLGYHPKGYWNRFPNPDKIPYVMPFFKDLFAEPLQTIHYTQAMGNAVRMYLDPVYYDTTDISLHRLSYMLGVDRMITGFRNYSTNLAPRIDSTAPMLGAFEQIYLAEGKQLNFMTFGSQADWPNYKEEIESKLKDIPLELQIIVAELALNVFDAYKWREMAVRNIETDDLLAMYAMKDMAETIGDGQVYYPEVDDVASALDAHSLYYGCMKAAQAAETASKKLKSYLATKPKELDKIEFDFYIPLGRIVLSGTRDNKHSHTDCAIMVDLGGNDTYTGNVGGTSSHEIPVAVAVDCGGDDKYINENPNLP